MLGVVRDERKGAAEEYSRRVGRSSPGVNIITTWRISCLFYIESTCTKIQEGILPEVSENIHSIKFEISERGRWRVPGFIVNFGKCLFSQRLSEGFSSSFLFFVGKGEDI